MLLTAALLPGPGTADRGPAASDCSFPHPTWEDRVERADRHAELPLDLEIVDEWDGIGPQSDGNWGEDCCTYIDLS